jgi:plasmid stabilization system protein ParE
VNTFWEPVAIDQAAGFLAEDPVGMAAVVGVAAVVSAVDEPSKDPRPGASSRLDLEQRRLRIGRYRIYYSLLLDGTIRIIRLGRVQP